MKFALIVLVVLPLALGAAVDEKRFLFDISTGNALTGGIDVFGMAKQILDQYGTPDSEAQCESTDCVSVLQSVGDLLHFHSSFVETLACKAICKEVFILANIIPH